MPIPLKFKAALDDSAFMAGIRRIKTASSKLGGAAGVGRRGTYGRGVGGNIGGLLGGAAALGAARSVLQTSDALYSLSRRTGMTTTSLAALAEMGKSANLEMEELAGGVVKMQQSMGTKKGQEAIESLGFSLRELKKLQPEVQFALIGDAISKMAEQTEKVTAAKAIFGRPGASYFDLFDTIGEMDMANVSANAKLAGAAAKDLSEAGDAIEKGKFGLLGKGAYIMNEAIKGGKQMVKDAMTFGRGFMQDRQNFFKGGNTPMPSPFTKDSYVQKPAMKEGSPFDKFITANKGGTGLGVSAGLGSVGGLSGGAYGYVKRGDAAIAKAGPIRMAQLKAAEEARDYLKELKETLDSWDQ